MNIPHKPGVFLDLSVLFHDLDTRLGCGISHISSLAVPWAMLFLLVQFLFKVTPYLFPSSFYEGLSYLA